MSEQVMLNWKVHPFKRNKKVSIGVILLLFLVWGIVYLATGSLLFLAIAVVMLLGSLSGFFLPTEYEFYTNKIKVKYFLASLEKEWKNYRSFYIDKNGVLLSPFKEPSRLENFRGVYLRLDRNSEIKDKVIDFIKSKMDNSVDGSR
ncbi:MAG TPA: hypothetical protein VGB16_05735 [candidate division Zixibacteria bacterium]